MAAESGTIKGADSFDHRLLFIVAEFREDRQRQNFSRGALRFREVSGPITEERQRILLVEAERVVDLRANVMGGKISAQIVAAWSADNVLVEDVSGARIRPWKHDAIGD